MTGLFSMEQGVVAEVIPTRSTSNVSNSCHAGPVCLARRSLCANRAGTGGADRPAAGRIGSGHRSGIRDVTLAAGQPCPKAANDEVVVCRTLDEPYRIPKTLRNAGPIAPTNQSWVNRAATIDEVGRKAGGLPNTCSPIGSGGQTGCTAANDSPMGGGTEGQAQRTTGR